MNEEKHRDGWFFRQLLEPDNFALQADTLVLLFNGLMLSFDLLLRAR